MCFVFVLLNKHGVHFVMKVPSTGLKEQHTFWFDSIADVLKLKEVEEITNKRNNYGFCEKCES